MSSNNIKKHYIALLLALVVGVISVAPQVFFIWSAPDFKGMHMFGADAEHHFLARINEVYDGHNALTGVFFSDKNRPYLQPALPENIVATVGKMLQFEAPAVNVLSKFLFPALIFGVIYIFAYSLFASKKIAILSALLAMFGTDLMSGPKYVLEMLTFQTSAYDFLPHTRPIHPQVSALFLFVGLYALFRTIVVKEKIDAKWAIIFGLILGFSVYVYIYTWSFLVVLGALYFLYFFYKKRKESTRFLFYAIVPHFIISIPYWINFFQARLDPAYADTAMRFGAIGGHDPVFGKWAFLLLVLALLFWPKKYKGTEMFFIFFALSLLIVLNQQVITGIVLQEAHYHWNITKPAGVAIASSMFFVYFLERFIKYKKIATLFVVVAAGLLFSHAALVQASSYKYEYPYWVERQRYGDLVNYLTTNYNYPRIIWTNDKAVCSYTSGYTRHECINNHSAVYYLENQNYFEKKLFLQYRFEGETPESIGATMRKEKGHVSRSVFAMYYKEKLGDYDLIPEEVISEIAKRYESFYERNYEDVLNELSINTVVWDKKTDRNPVYPSLFFLQEVARINEDFVIYEVAYEI